MSRGNDVQYGRVTAVSGTTVTVDLEANSASVTAVAVGSYPAPTAGDRVVLVGQGQSWLAVTRVASSGGDWTDWSSSASFAAGVTVGNGSFAGSAYTVIGPTCHWRFMFQLGSTSSITGAVEINRPFDSPTSLDAYAFVGMAVDANGNDYPMHGFPSTTTAFFARVSGATSTYALTANLSSTIPFTWASTDRLLMSGTQEIA